MMRLFKPKHSLASVIKTLHFGLKEDTVVLDHPVRWSAFADLGQAIQQTLQQFSDDPETQKLGPTVRSRLALVYRPLSPVTSCLMSLVPLAREVRQKRGSALANDLAYYAGRLVSTHHDVSRLSVDRMLRMATASDRGADDGVQDILSFANDKQSDISLVSNNCRRLGTALTEAPSIVEELSLELELRSVQLLQEIVAKVKTTLEREIYFSTSNVRALPGLVEALREAISSPMRRQLDELQVLGQVLETALLRSRVTLGPYIPQFRHKTVGNS